MGYEVGQKGQKRSALKVLHFKDKQARWFARAVVAVSFQATFYTFHMV